MPYLQFYSSINLNIFIQSHVLWWYLVNWPIGLKFTVRLRMVSLTIKWEFICKNFFFLDMETSCTILRICGQNLLFEFIWSTLIHASSFLAWWDCMVLNNILLQKNFLMLASQIFVGGLFFPFCFVSEPCIS